MFTEQWIFIHCVIFIFHFMSFHVISCSQYPYFLVLVLVRVLVLVLVRVLDTAINVHRNSEIHIGTYMLYMKNVMN